MTEENPKPAPRSDGARWRALSWPARLLALPFLLYRGLISPLKPPSCRFEPTCSTYALEALARHGALRGIWLTVRRVARCHPITWLGGGSGYDPVPPSRRQRDD